jgi:hypothetical protein
VNILGGLVVDEDSPVESCSAGTGSYRERLVPDTVVVVREVQRSVDMDDFFDVAY